MKFYRPIRLMLTFAFLALLVGIVMGHQARSDNPTNPIHILPYPFPERSGVYRWENYEVVCYVFVTDGQGAATHCYWKNRPKLGVEI